MFRLTEFRVNETAIMMPMDYNNTEIVQLDQLGWDLAVQMFTEPTPEYGYYQISLDQKFNYINQTTGLPQSYTVITPLELEHCGLGFNYPDKDELKFKGIDKYQCLKNKTNLAIGGTFLSNVYQYISISVFPCMNSSKSNVTCASPEA